MVQKEGRMENRAERMVRPGEIYRHFKGELYQIVAVAVHSETGEKMVVYQALYGDFAVYVRPFLMFISEVEREKYPDVKQRYRFERVQPQREEPQGVQLQREEPQGVELQGVELRGVEPQGAERQEAGLRGDEWQKMELREGGETGRAEPNPALMEFLDARGVEERIACLREWKGGITQADLDSIYVALDMQARPGGVKEQLDEVIRCLAMQRHYEGGRLR